MTCMDEEVSGRQGPEPGVVAVGVRDQDHSQAGGAR